MKRNEGRVLPPNCVEDPRWISVWPVTWTKTWARYMCARILKIRWLNFMGKTRGKATNDKTLWRTSVDLSRRFLSSRSSILRLNLIYQLEKGIFFFQETSFWYCENFMKKLEVKVTMRVIVEDCRFVENYLLLVWRLWSAKSYNIEVVHLSYNTFVFYVSLCLICYIICDAK